MGGAIEASILALAVVGMVLVATWLFSAIGAWFFSTIDKSWVRSGRGEWRLAAALAGPPCRCDIVKIRELRIQWTTWALPYLVVVEREARVVDVDWTNDSIIVVDKKIGSTRHRIGEVVVVEKSPFRKLG